jgi:hypothetical protein
LRSTADLFEQLERVALLRVGRGDDVEGGRPGPGAGYAAGIAHEGGEFGHQRREAVCGRAVVDFAAAHLVQRQFRALRRRHRVARGLGRLVNVGEHQQRPSLAQVLSIHAYRK